MPIKFNAICPKKIIIEKDVWIASGVRILGGNIIRERNIIGAGAVLTKILNQIVYTLVYPLKE